MALVVQAAGAQSLIVDEGRPHSRALGLPVGGAADKLSFALANALVGNPPNTPALEVALAGPTLEATAAHAMVVFGAPFGVFVNNQPREVGKTFAVRPGDAVTIGTTPNRLRAYVCVPGGFRSPEVMKSRSAFEAIRPGQFLECRPSALRARWLPAGAALSEDLSHLRVLPGSHAGRFSTSVFESEPYTVRPESNRMGLRLSGKPIASDNAGPPAAEPLSAPVCPGTVQVTHDRLPVVLGMDAQTIGGYPRVAHVIAADLDKLAQLRPGDSVRFVRVEGPQAAALFRERQAWKKGWVTRLEHSNF